MSRLTLFVAAGALLFAWSVVVPVYEAPDEPAHWQAARLIHDARRLPIYGPDVIEANQPPLYYLIVAPLATPSDAPTTLFTTDGRGQLVLLYPPRMHQNVEGDLRRFLPIRFARFVTALLSLGAVVFSFRAGLEATGRRETGLLAAGLVAFLPQFTFRGGHVSNDGLAATLGALCVWRFMVIIRRGLSVRETLIAATAVAAAYLTKVNAIGLAPALAVVILTDQGSIRSRLRHLALGLGTALVLVAPWSIMNIVRYGDPFAANAMPAAVPHLIAKKSILSPYFVTAFPKAFLSSFIAKFGWMSIPMPMLWYAPYVVVGALSVLGAVYRVRIDASSRRPILVCALIAVLTLATVIHINLSFNQPQGRYMFPALAAMMLMAALGLEAPRVSAQAAARLANSIVVLALAGNAVVLGTVIWPAYYPPLTPDRSLLQLPLTADSRRPDATRADGHEGAPGNRDAVLLAIDREVEHLWFLQFTVGGKDRAIDQIGRVTVTPTDPQRASFSADFEWSADGVPRRITIPFIGRPEWRGRMARLRIDPFVVPSNAGSAGVKEVTLRGALEQYPR